MSVIGTDVVLLVQVSVKVTSGAVWTAVELILTTHSLQTEQPDFLVIFL